MIHSLHLPELRNNELLQFLNDILQACRQYSTEPMRLTAVIEALLSNTTEFEHLFRLNPASEITRELIDLDNQRDNCILGINSVLFGYAYHFDAATKKAAQDLLQSMDKYGKRIAKMNYPAETQVIKSLLSDWTTKPHLACAITKLSLTTWTQELSKSNNLFAEKYILRAEEKSSQPQVKTYEARKKAIASYKKLISKIDAGAIHFDDNSFDALINLINKLVEKYKVVVNSHATADDPENTPNE